MSAAKTPWIDYRMRQILLWNRGHLDFKGATMLYNQVESILAIEPRSMTFTEMLDVYSAVGGGFVTKGGKVTATEAPEVKNIFYDMEPEGFDTLRFYHPTSRGAGVVLLPPSYADTRVFYLMQRDGRSMFSKDYTLNEVSRGKIKSTRAVWQFHGYKHEH